MMIPSYSIKKLYALHKRDCPDSQISLNAIREAVNSGRLPFIEVGNRKLIRLDVFEKWQSGSLGND